MKRDGPPVTAKVLAEEFKLTTMGVRQHLQGLEEDGLVDFKDIKAKVGRPTRHWNLTSKGHRRFADRHGDLIIQMLDSVEEIFGADGLHQVVERRENQTFELYRHALANSYNLKEKLEILTTLREQEATWPNFIRTVKTSFWWKTIAQFAMQPSVVLHYVNLNSLSSDACWATSAV